MSIVSNGHISKFSVAAAYFRHQYTLIKSSIALWLLPFPVSISEIIETLFIGSTVQEGEKKKKKEKEKNPREENK